MDFCRYETPGYNLGCNDGLGVVGLLLLIPGYAGRV